jgi:hypothetical protein
MKPAAGRKGKGAGKVIKDAATFSFRFRRQINTQFLSRPGLEEFIS